MQVIEEQRDDLQKQFRDYQLEVTPLLLTVGCWQHPGML